MSATKICRICLHTDVELHVLSDHLSDFYEELCDYTTDNSATLSCLECAQVVKKCHSFKKHVQKADKLLRNWKKKKSRDKDAIEKLHQQLTPFYLTNAKKTPKSHTSIKHIETVEIKNESPTIDIIQNVAKTELEDVKNDDILENKYNDNSQSYNNDGNNIQTNNNDGNQNYHNDANITYNNDEVGNENDEKHMFINDGPVSLRNDDDENDSGDNDNNDSLHNDGDDSDDDEDKFLSDWLTTVDNIKVEKDEKGKAKTKTRKRGLVKKEEIDEDKPKRKRMRKPLTNKEEYETVFDIQLFDNDEEAKQEFELRKYTERYINAQFKCNVCFTVYKCQKLLDFHMRWHDPSAGDFSCTVCYMRFKRHISVRKHNNDVHHGLYKCKRCPLVTYHKMVMVHHFQKHQGVQFKCKLCNGVYKHSSTYMTHLRTRHRSEHVCVTCARTFVSQKGLMAHRKKMHKLTTQYDPPSESQVTCTDCKLTFPTRAVYVVHILNTPKHKDLATTIIGCPECGDEYENKMLVRQHRRKVHPSYNYSAMRHAEKNLAKGRREDERIFDCTMGAEKAHHKEKKERERQGQREPRELRVFHCEMCGKTGTHNTWLYRHYQTDHPEVPYEQVYNERRKHLCDECGRSFFTITALREHKHVHTGAKPYCCDKCPAKFRRKSSLKMHLERHLPPSRECQHCGKKFVSASNLSNHIRSHVGDRRYKCSICGKGFLHSAAMREHVRGVHHHIRRTRKHPHQVPGLE